MRFLRAGEVFDRFVRSEQAGSLLLIACTIAALVLANSPVGPGWLSFWHLPAGGLTLELWVNDALMAVFFLLIGLELQRELLAGELSDPRKAALPAVAAFGGMVVPALIHWSLNAGLPSQSGFGIPMATDIAFALGALAVLGNRIPLALRVFVVAFAVIDDLGAIIVIALFYSGNLSLPHLLGALGVWCVLFAMGRFARITALTPYLLGGIVLWVLTLQSGVHATLAGVALAFTIPFRGRPDAVAPSERLEHALSRPVALAIIPVFALANAGVVIDAGALREATGANALGIFGGLVLGKPVGIVLFSVIAVALGLSRLPTGVNWRQMLGAGMLGGIGFTMSIFIGNLAFGEVPAAINVSKLAILAASLTSAALGYIWLRAVSRGQVARG
jgi:NhaA family Na+:H+ antiporter